MDNKLSKPVFVKLSSLENGTDGYNVYVKVVSVEVSNNEEGKTPIAKAVIADQTAASNAFFRGETVKLIKVGAVLAIRNGRINYVKDHISLEIDAFGRVTSENLDIKTKTDFNISEAEAKRKPRRRNNDDKPRRGGHRNQGDNERRPRREGDQERRPQREHNDRPPRQHRQHREHNDRPPRQHRQHRQHREHNDRPPRQHREHNDKPRDNNRPPRQYQKRQDHGDRPPRREFQERKQPTKFTKIGAIEPGDDNLNLIAKVISAKEVGKRVRVVLGDETGIVNGFLYLNDSIKEDASVVIFKCEAKVVKQHIQIQLMERGKVDQARRKVESVNQKVNVSAKEWIESA